jgi:hypothetical protein
MLLDLKKSPQRVMGFLSDNTLMSNPVLPYGIPFRSHLLTTLDHTARVQTVPETRAIDNCRTGSYPARMGTYGFLKTSIALALSLLIALSSYTLSEHVHQDFASEVDCEQCAQAGSFLAGEIESAVAAITPGCRASTESARLPFEQFSQAPQSRGPPFLS